MKWMKKQGHEVVLDTHKSKNIWQKVEWADVVILQMVFSDEFVRKIKEMGKVVIFECDDLIHSVPKTHYSYSETKGLGGLKLLWKTWKVLKQCDGFIGSNNKLKRIYGWMAKSSFSFPNYPALEFWLKEPKKNTTDKIRLLWAGSTSHIGDLQMIKPIIKKLLERNPQVQFIYIGAGGVSTKDLYARFVYGEDVFEGIPVERRESMLAAPGNVWPYILASLQADIAIAPLEKNYFNKFKTQCKYLEYAINSIPGVYSGWFYTDVKEGETGYLANTPDEWIEKMEILINDATIRERIGARARQEVIDKHNANDHLSRWQRFVEKTYESFKTSETSTTEK